MRKLIKYFTLPTPNTVDVGGDNKTMRKLPEHIVSCKPQETASQYVKYDYYDMLNNIGIYEGDLKSYLFALPIMVYWTTWDKHKQRKQLHP